MPFAALLIGAILIVVAFNNSAGALVSELETDVPAFFKWAAAIVAILALGYIPGLKTPSRWLLGLVLLVVLLANYQAILSGFQTFLTSGGASTGAGTAQANPSASYVASYAPAAASAGSTPVSTGAGSSTAAAASTTMTAAQALAANPLNPNAYTALASGFGGLVA